MNPIQELEKYVSFSRTKGISDDLIRSELLKAGWDIITINLALSTGIQKKEEVRSNQKDSSKKHHYIFPIIIFCLSLSFFIFLGIIIKKFSTTLIIGGIAISTVVTLVFYLIDFIIRKISNKFGKFWRITLWLLLIIITCIFIFLWFKNNYPGYIYTTPGSIVTSNKKLNANECIKTENEMLKRACGLNLAIENKDRSLCRKIFGETEYGYYCEYLYDERFDNQVAPSISECQSMTISPEGSSFYKDSCFYRLAQITFDKKVCKNILDNSTQENCTAVIDDNIYRKNNLCPALFSNNKIPNSYDCFEYVYNLKDPKMCEKLSPPQWAKEECIKRLK